MVKSLLSPEKIIGNKNPKSSFGSLSGKNSLGSSVISKSSNKIVGFNRAKVSTNKGEVQKIVSNLSTNNIANSSNNIIKNIFGSLQAKQNKEEENKEKRFGIFGFFDSIKDAFNLIRFVGSKKNLDKIKDSLENLKITFSETFDTAKILRKIIKKIFDQLSGLSGDGGGGKGLWGLIAAAIASIIRKLFRGVMKTFSDIFERMSKNENTTRDIIDKIAPPPTLEPSALSIGTAATTVGGIATGSGLASLPAAGTATKALPAAGSATKALPEAKGVGNIFSKMPKKGKFGLIAAGLGLATLGGTSMMNKSGLSQPGGEDVQPGDTAPEVPGNVLDKFNSILDRFDKILDGLKGKPEKSSGASSSSSSNSKPASSSAPPGGSPPTGPIQYGPLPLSMSNKQAFSSIYELAKKNGDPMPELTAAQAMFESGYLSSSNTKNLNNPFGQSGTGNKGSSGGWAAYNSLEDSVKDHINKWQNDYKGYKGMGTYGSPLEGLRSSINAYTPASENNQANYLKAVASILATMGFDPNKKNPIVDLSTNALIQQRKPGASGITAPTAPILPSPEQIAQTQGLAVQRGQGRSSVVVLPGAQQQAPTQQSGGGQLVAPPSPAKSGPEMPRLLASNPDNFLNLYSRMVYNIVDG